MDAAQPRAGRASESLPAFFRFACEELTPRRQDATRSEPGAAVSFLGVSAALREHRGWCADRERGWGQRGRGPETTAAMFV